MLLAPDPNPSSHKLSVFWPDFYAKKGLGALIIIFKDIHVNSFINWKNFEKYEIAAKG